MITNWKTQGKVPDAPYYAVIFISVKKPEMPGYDELDDLLMEKASEQAGYLGYSVVKDGHQGIFISYWESKSAIEKWRNDNLHKEAKAQAPFKWYEYYHSMICRVENSNVFDLFVQNTNSGK